MVHTGGIIDTAAIQADQLGAGDLVIHEIMVNPTDCPDENGEYLEIYNNTNDKIELFGLKISDNSQSTEVIKGVTIPANGLVLGVRKPVTTHCYGGLPFDFQYRDIELGNVGDNLTISNASGTIDTVDFSTWSVPKGASMALISGNRTSSDNDVEANWCISGTTITDGVVTYADYGSPGTTNICATPIPLKRPRALPFWHPLALWTWTKSWF